MTTTAPTQTPTQTPTHSDAFIEEHRDINTSCHDWWDYVEEDFKLHTLAPLGIDADRINFSLSYSQGDGASFDGRIHDWQLFLPYVYRQHPEHPCHHPLVLTHAQVDWTMHWKDRGRCPCLSASDFSTDLRGADHGPNDLCDPDSFDDWHYNYGPQPYKDPDNLTAHTTYALLADIDPALVEKHCIEAIIDLAYDLYKALRDEYEYLTSDEAVIDTLIANDITETDE